MYLSFSKRLCSSLLVCMMTLQAVTTSSFAMQKVATSEGINTNKLSSAIEQLQRINTRRTEAHNANPRDASIPKETLSMNVMYERHPSHRKATDAEREIAIKGLMVTAALHGPDAMRLNLPTISQRQAMTTSMQHHYSIVEAVDGLSRDYFIGELLDSDARYDVLNTFAGLTRTNIDSWFKDICHELTGLTKFNARYWWHQKHCAEVTNTTSYTIPLQPTSYSPITDAEARSVLRDEKLRALFFAELNKVPTKDRHGLGRSVLTFMSLDMKQAHMTALMTSLSQVGDKRSECVRLAKQLIKSDMNAGDITTIVHALCETFGNREKIVELTQQLIDFDHNDYCPSGPGSMSFAMSHFTCSLDGSNQSNGTKIFASDKAAEIVLAIQALGSITGNRTYFLECAKTLLPPDTKSYVIAEIASSLSQVHADERSEFIELAKQLIEPCLMHNSDSWAWTTPEYAIERIVHLLANIQGDRRKYIELAKGILGKDADGLSLVQAANALSQFPDDKRNEFIELVQQFIRSNTNDHSMNNGTYNVADIVFNLSQIKRDREEFINMARKLLSANASGSAVAQTANSLSHMEEADRKKFIELIKQLIKTDMRDHEISDIMFYLNETNKHDREKFITLAKELLPANAVPSAVTQTARSLSQVHDDERSEFVELAKQLLPTNANGNGAQNHGTHTEAYAISSLSGIRGDRKKFIELARGLLPVHADGPSIAQMANSLSRVHGGCGEFFIELTRKVINLNNARTQYGYNETQNVINIVSSLSSIKGDHEEFVQLAKQVLPADVDGSSVAQTAFILSRLQEDREKFVELTKQLFQSSRVSGNELASTMSSLSSIRGDRERFIQMARQALPDAADGSSIARTAQSLSRMQGNCEKLIKSVKQLNIKPGSHACYVANIIQTLGCFKESDHEIFVGLVNQLIGHDMCGESAYNIISALHHVSEGDREKFVSLAKQLIRSDMSGDCIKKIISTLSQVSEGDRENFVKFAKQLIRPDMADHNICEIISLLSQVQEDDREIFVKVSNQLIRRDMDDQEVKKIINAIQGAKGNLEDFQRIVNHNMNSYQIINFISTMASVQNDRANLIELASQLISPDVHDVREIISRFLRVQGDREKFVRLVKQLIRPNMYDRNICEIISLFSQVEDNKREDFVSLVNQLIRPNMDEMQYDHMERFLSILLSDKNREDFLILANRNLNYYQISSFISAMARVHSNRPNLITLASQLIRFDMRGSDIESIVSALLGVEGNLEDFQKLATHNMNGDQTSRYISAMAHVHKDRANLIPLTLKFISLNVYGHDISRIISALSELREKKEHLVSLASQLIRPQMYEYEINDVISRLNRIKCNHVDPIARILLFRHHIYNQDYMDLVRQVFDTPLGEFLQLRGMRAAEQGANRYAGGINVHAEGRDQRTLAAIQTLVASWNPEVAEIEQEFTHFWKAVGALNTKLQKPLLRTLGVDINQEPVHQQSTHDFGGLLTGGDQAITLIHGGHVLKINARELIARFWHFANAYIPEADDITVAPGASLELVRDTIRTGIVNGLADGLQQDSKTSSHVVCDPGKVQRLVVSTLQGRLKGADGKVVDVDDLGLNKTAMKSAVVHDEAQVNHNDQVQQPVHAVQNLNEIGQYLQPFIDDLANTQPKDANEFFIHLFRYRDNLEVGNTSFFGGQPINLSSDSVVYYVRMMEPAIWEKGKMIVSAEINPEKSLMAQLGYDVFRVDDYLAYFGEQDIIQLTAARAEDQRRALIEEQNREYAAMIENDQKAADIRDGQLTLKHNLKEVENREDRVHHPTTEQLRELRARNFK